MVGAWSSSWAASHAGVECLELRRARLGSHVLRTDTVRPLERRPSCCRRNIRSHPLPSACLYFYFLCSAIVYKLKGKVLPYSLPSVGPGADPGVQAVSSQVTWSHPPGGGLPLLSARPAVTFPAEERHRPSAGTKLYCLVTEAHECEQLARGCYLEADRPRFEPATFWIARERSTVKPHRPQSCRGRIFARVVDRSLRHHVKETDKQTHRRRRRG